MPELHTAPALSRFAAFFMSYSFLGLSSFWGSSSFLRLPSLLGAKAPLGLARVCWLVGWSTILNYDTKLASSC